MSDEAMADNISSGAPTLVFHPEFATQNAGDVILRAGDDVHAFYFPHILLLATSSFFANLPPPTLPQDMYNGTPVIPLPETTSAGMRVFLALLRTINDTSGVETETLYQMGGEAVLEAVLAAKRYECPIVIRLLRESLPQPSPWYQRLLYAIYVLADLPNETAAMAKIVAGQDITRMDPEVVDMLKLHAPHHWMRLQDLSLRRFCRLPEFYQSLHQYEDVQAYYDHSHEECSDPGMDPDVRVMDALKRAETVEEIKELMERSYGLRCSWCQDGARDFYDKRVQALVDFAGEY